MVKIFSYAYMKDFISQGPLVNIQRSNLLTKNCQKKNKEQILSSKNTYNLIKTSEGKGSWH